MNLHLLRGARALALGFGLLAVQCASSVGQPNLAPVTIAASPSSPAASAAAETPQATPPAGATLSAFPSIVSAAVKPGATSTSTVTLKAGMALDVTITPVGLGQSLDGTFSALPDAQDTSPYSARSFISVTPGTLQLAAGESRDVSVKIQVPAGAGDGTRYAILQVASRPAGSDGNVGIGVVLGISVVVTLDGTAQARTGSLQGLSIDASLPSDPLSVSATLRNTGNAHYGAPPNTVSASATLQGGAGPIATAKMDVTGNSLIPTFGRHLALSIAPPAPLVDGTYLLVVQANLQDGTVLDRETLQFQEHSGAVLGITGVPNPEPPAPTNNNDVLTLLLASLIGAGVAVFALTALRAKAGRRRPPTPTPSA